MNLEVSELASEVYVKISDGALKSSGTDASSPASLPCACL